jgi:hypothetical protein
MGAVVILAGVLGGPLFLAKAIPFAEHQAVAHWSAQPRRLASRVGLATPRGMHQELLSRFGSKDTREKLAEARRMPKIPVPAGSTVIIRLPKPQPSGGRRTP